MFGVLTSRILFFDIASIIILTMVLGSVFLNKMTHGIQNRLFITYIFITLSTTIFDILRCVLPSLMGFDYNSRNLVISYIIQDLYFVSRVVHLPMYILYIIVASNSLTNFKRHKSYSFLLCIPYAVVCIFLVVNNFHPIFFKFSENLEFIRCKGMIIIYASSIIYMIEACLYLIHYFKLFGKLQVISLLSVVILNIAAVGIQTIAPRLLIELFCTTLAILLITFTFHHPDGLRNTELNVMTYKTFMQEIQKAALIKKNQSIVFAGIKNFLNIFSNLPYSDLNNLLTMSRDKCFEIDKELGLKSRIFYFDNCTFALISETKQPEKIKIAGQKLYDFFENHLTIQKLGIKIIPSVCTFDFPDDIVTSNEVITFGRTYMELLPNQKMSIDISSIKEKTDFRIKNEINEIISRAIADNKFEMYYQPIYNLKSKKFTSAEALIRLKDEKYGFISPEIFISSAEKTGAIYQIGDFILEDVIKFIASDNFKKSGLEYIEINLSVAQCLQPDLAEKIGHLITKYEIKPSQINLEITERESIYDQTTFDNNMNKLINMGVNFSLDDYGTGYSNIRRIFQLPLRIVKIDKSFVNDLESPQILAIITNTVKMLQSIGKEIVVEGVEDYDTVKFFADLECDYIQGYYYSRPLDQKNFISFVTSKNSI